MLRNALIIIGCILAGLVVIAVSEAGHGWVAALYTIGLMIWLGVTIKRDLF